MGQESGRDVIRLRGARQNNLKGFDLELPVRRLIVVTGLSGSGKSSLAFDTLYAEGQRRYIETFSPYARQFFDRMDKPRVDSIEGIPPAVALEQRNSVRTTRSTVGTLTEICDHMKVLWPHLARLHCRQCGCPVTRDAPRDVWTRLLATPGTESGNDAGGADADATRTEVLVTFALPLSTRLSLDEQLGLVGRQGFQRLLVQGEVVRVEDAAARLGKAGDPLTVIQDRVRLVPNQRARFVEAAEQAYHFGHGRLAVVSPADAPTGPRGGSGWTQVRRFSRDLHCASCDLDYRPPLPALFSFNHPIGACPACKGFGRVIGIDYDQAIPDRTKTLADGAVKPWQTATGLECQRDLAKAARREGVPLDVPFRDLSPDRQRWVIEGDPNYGEGNEWPRAWYGVKGYFRYLESKAYKMHVRVLLSRYRAYRTCPACDGQRFQPESLLWRLAEPSAIRAGRDGDDRETMRTAPGTADSWTLADFYALPVSRARRVIEALARAHGGNPRDPVALALGEVGARLEFLDAVGVGYLTLDRTTRTLSGGETQRVNLTTCLGSRLVNTLFVLDEPSVGLHARDTDRLVRVLERLRDLGNTVVVVEHEAAVMQAADHIVDLGPGHGEAGGEIVAQGTYSHILRDEHSLTGAYLSGRRRIPVPLRRPVRFPASDPARAPAGLHLEELAAPYRTDTPVPAASRVTPRLRLTGVTRHNLRELNVEIPLERLVCLSGVSGSGKTTLASELLRMLRDRLGVAPDADGALDAREDEKDADGEQAEDRAAWTDARLEGAEALTAVILVDQSPLGRTPRSNPAVYSGAFEHLRELFAHTDEAKERGLKASAFSFNSGQGQCEQCRGAGFEKIEMQFLSDVFIRCPACQGRRYRPHVLEIRLPAAGGIGGDGLSIADLLELSVDDALTFLAAQESRSASGARNRLQAIQDVGLGYLRLGQPINTLSGGESQRLKLARYLAWDGSTDANLRPKGSLFVFDEPTTGLHFEDVRVLLLAFQRLVDLGQSVLIIEHHLDVLKSADWLVDLGPEGGSGGGRIVAAGTPEDVAACSESHTGRALAPLLGPCRAS